MDYSSDYDYDSEKHNQNNPKDENPTKVGLYGYTPLHCLVELQDQKGLSKILASYHNLNLNQPNDVGSTPYSIAENYGKDSLIYKMLKRYIESTPPYDPTIPCKLVQ